MMKKTFEMPVMVVSRFCVEDIITASGVTTSATSKAKGALSASGVSENSIFTVTLGDIAGN